MAKEAPALTITVNSNDISNDVTNCDFATPRGVQEVTGVDLAYMERLLLLADFSATLNGVFNDAASHAHATFKNAPSVSASVTSSIAASGQTLTVNNIWYTDLHYTRAIDGSLTWSVPLVLADTGAPSWS